MLADPDAHEFEVTNARPRLQAVNEALDRIDRVSRIARGVASTRDRIYLAWSELARVVRERVDLPELFAMAGWKLRKAGRSSRRGEDEYAGACPLCGGSDRLRVWSGPNGRAWCRQCEWSADAIAVTRSIVLPGAGFRDAVSYLADYVGASKGGVQ
jgi:hypothetical protein